MAKDSVANKNAPIEEEEQVTAMQVVAFKLRDEEYGVNISTCKKFTIWLI